MNTVKEYEARLLNPDDVAGAYKFCSNLARRHYENFPVASLLMPKTLRRHVAALYAFARIADDFSDEPEYEGVRRERLLDWRRQLDEIGSKPPSHPVFLALGAIFHMSPADVLTMDAHNVKSDSPLVGLLAHLVVSILWGIGYAYAAATRPNIAGQPWISGIVFGVIVWVLMQFILMLGAVWPGLTLQTTAIGLIAHMLFFGIPVALTARALQKA